MTPQIQNILALMSELVALALALTVGLSPSDAALLLDRWLRVRSFTAVQRDAAGISDQFEQLDTRLAGMERQLAVSAGQGVDLEALWQRGLALLDAGTTPEAEAWGRDLLLLANLAPVIPGDRGMRARGMVERCLDLASAEPLSFLGAASVALDRWEHEPVDDLDAFSLAAHRALETLPLEAAIDASAVPLPGGKLRSLIDPIRNGTVLREDLKSLPAEDQPWIHAIRPRVRQRVGTASPSELSSSWRMLIARADDAIQDALGWRGELAAMLARGRAAGAVRCYADSDPGDMLRLGRHVEEDWWLVHDARGFSLQGPKLDDVTVTAIQGEQRTVLERTSAGAAARWLLPAVALWTDGLRLQVRVDADSFHFELPGEGSEA
jgi:hypothetical protein